MAKEGIWTLLCESILLKSNKDCKMVRLRLLALSHRLVRFSVAVEAAPTFVLKQGPIS
jgi:hypothetical protein